MDHLKGLYEFRNAPEHGAMQSEVRVAINASHPIFKGHFPDRPVLPGVCMVQIATDLASVMHGSALTVSKARSIKFLAPVDPSLTPELVYTTTLTAIDSGIKADIQAIAAGTIVLKMSAELVGASN